MNEAAEAAVETYPFNQDSLIALRADPHIQGNWPIVYILCDPNAGRAYIGETTDALSRLGTHLRHPEKGTLSQTNIISSFYFNKSATLDLESSLIELMHADETFTLLNANLGLVNHNYYQKNEVYRKLLKKIWEKLVELNIAKKPIEQIHNSDVFKYSPYKSLSPDQKESLVGILDALIDNKVKTLLVEGEAGTG
jgi:predicted GIY-YIG superfamily endonuclease